MSRWIALACVVAACGGQTPSLASDGAIATLPSDPRALQRLVLEGVNPDLADECYAGPIWGAVDDPIAGQRLDAILHAIATKAAPTSREDVCIESIASARLLRMARLGTLDLSAELWHRDRAARAVAARHVQVLAGRGAHVETSVRAPLRRLLADPDPVVSFEAHEAVIAIADQEAISDLQVIAARDDDARPLACHALRSLGAPGDCGPGPAATTGGLLTASGARDSCTEAKAQVASSDARKQREGLLFFAHEQFGRSSITYSTMRRLLEGASICELDPAIRDAFLSSPSSSPSLRALAAVVVLWERAAP